MSKVKVGAHYIVTHNRPQDMDFVAACPAPSAKIVYSSTPNADHVREVMRRAPARVVLRDHPLSEQHDDIWRDPAGTGRRHAREWKQHLDEIGGLDFNRILVEGVNEFPHWLENGIQTQLIYELAFGNEAQRLGVNTLHCQFPVGWPGNGGIADAPPDWKPWEPILAWIDAHPGTFLAIHEYWGFNTGVHFYAGWWFLRYRKMPHKGPTMLTELGGLRARQNPDETFGLVARDGWKGNDEDKDSGISAEQYLAQWQQAEVELRTDLYIDSAHLFTTDGAHPWIEECDAEPVNGRWVQWARQQTELPLAKPGATPPAVYIPSLPNDGPMPPSVTPSQPQSEDNWQRVKNFILAEEGGYQNNPADSGNWTSGKVGIGEQKGTNWGISAASYPYLDIVNLTLIDAIAIYRRDYWQKSGADQLPWPACLLMMDTAVLHGVGAATKMLAEVGPNPYAFAAKRLRIYTASANWHIFGAGWTNRIAALFEAIHE